MDHAYSNETRQMRRHGMACLWIASLSFVALVSLLVVKL